MWQDDKLFIHVQLIYLVNKSETGSALCDAFFSVNWSVGGGFSAGTNTLKPYPCVSVALESAGGGFVNKIFQKQFMNVYSWTTPGL